MFFVFVFIYNQNQSPQKVTFDFNPQFCGKYRKISKISPSM